MPSNHMAARGLDLDWITVPAAAALPVRLHIPETLSGWLWPSLWFLIALSMGLLAAFVTVSIASRAARRANSAAGQILVQRMRRPLLLIGPLVAAHVSLTVLVISDATRVLLHRILMVALIVAVAWLLISVTRATQQIVQSRFRMDVRDNLEARRINTQVNVLQRIAMVVIVIVAAGAMLMTFPQLRQLGTSLLASAGLAGLVVGFAARPVLTNLIAGVQLALAQPIRLDDVVIVENEWGRIEEILATYVVVRLWDERRLVVPLSHFVEKPFQNWTRTRADILGTVFLHVDYSVPVEAVREELHRILKQTELWDGRAWALQVTDLTERTMQLRALMSAIDAGRAFDLRCFVRERLVDFVRSNYPHALPRMRTELLESPSPRQPRNSNHGAGQPRRPHIE